MAAPRIYRDSSRGHPHEDCGEDSSTVPIVRVYVASAKAGIVALDAMTGEPAWTYALAGANHHHNIVRRLTAGGPRQGQFAGWKERSVGQMNPAP